MPDFKELEPDEILTLAREKNPNYKKKSPRKGPKHVGSNISTAT